MTNGEDRNITTVPTRSFELLNLPFAIPSVSRRLAVLAKVRSADVASSFRVIHDCPLAAEAVGLEADIMALLGEHTLDLHRHAGLKGDGAGGGHSIGGTAPYLSRY